MKFDGETYQPERDHERLETQYERVAALMADAKWRTLEEIGEAVKAPPASVSARLRDMRKERNWRSWEREERETAKRIKELRKEEARVKARTRSASRKDADAAVAAERKRVSEAARRTAWNARQIKELAEKIIRAAGGPQ